MIAVKKNKLNMFVHILIDSEPDASMILCKSEADAEKLIDTYFSYAMSELKQQKDHAIAKIRLKSTEALETLAR